MTEIFEKELTEFEIAEAEAWAAGEYDREYAEVERQRQAAYQAEADPLFFKSKRGKATEKEWLDKIDEIDARFPYPEPPKGKK